MECSRGVSSTVAVSLPSDTMDSSRCTCPHTCLPSRHPAGCCKSYYSLPHLHLYTSEFRICKRITLVLVILLNFLVAGATPTHRVRHRHNRNILYADRLCENPGVKDQPTPDQCSTMAARVRRDVNHMDLREGQDSSLCPYSVCVDEDPSRRPVHIHKVYCLQSGCRCTHEGAYRCTQLYNKVEVWYPSTNETKHQEVEYGCVCAAKHGNQVDPFVPDTGDK